MQIVFLLFLQFATRWWESDGVGSDGTITWAFKAAFEASKKTQFGADIYASEAKTTVDSEQEKRRFGVASSC